jgi:hypothetical protein
MSIIGRLLTMILLGAFALLTRVAVGRDIESASLLNFGNGFRGTSTTAPTATTFTTDGVNIPVNSVVGQMIFTGSVVGIIQSNTSAANSVLTIDRWYDISALPGTRNTAAASTPAAGLWQIAPGNAPGLYMGLTATSTAAVDGDTTLTGEIDNSPTAGLIRALATYAHTAAGSTTTLTKTYTATGTDSLPVTVAQIGVFQGLLIAASRMIFRTVLSASATLTTTGDQLQVTETVTL